MSIVSINKIKASLSKHKTIWIACGLLGLLTLAAIVCLAVFKPWQTDMGTDQNNVALSAQDEPDYITDLTTLDGEEFNPTINKRAGSDIGIHIDSLQCDNTCSNVSQVKVGDRLLKEGEDYEIKKGSIVLIIFVSVVEELPNGKTEITFIVESDGDKRLIGVRITVVDEPIEEQCSDCSEDESQPQSSSSRSSSAAQELAQPNSSSEDPAKVACESRTDTPDFYQFVGWSVSAEDKAYEDPNDPFVGSFGGFSVYTALEYKSGVCTPKITGYFGDGFVSGLFTASDYYDNTSMWGEHLKEFTHYGVDRIKWYRNEAEWK